MAKTLKARGKEQEAKALPVTTGFKAKNCVSYVERIEEEQAEINEIMEKARDKCAPFRENIDAIKNEAGDDNIPRKELNTLISERRFLAKAERCRERLSEEQQDIYDQMKHALGMLSDTPLGLAAMESHEAHTTPQ